MTVRATRTVVEKTEKTTGFKRPWVRLIPVDVRSRHAT